MRKKFIAGNWKMHFNLDEAVSFAEEIKTALGSQDAVDVAVCTNAIALAGVAKTLSGSNVAAGAQNAYFEDKGAFTGEISTTMVKSTGAQYVIIGHSERRTLFGDTDEIVNKKLKKVIADDLLAIFCVGETLEEREGNITEKVLDTQIREGLAGIDGDTVKTITVAYEPVWAIGTGKVASPEQAEAAHAFIRQLIGELYSQDVADAVRIQYGGSVKPGNAKELLTQPNIDGALVGGASLKTDDFAGIVNYDA